MPPPRHRLHLHPRHLHSPRNQHESHWPLGPLRRAGRYRAQTCGICRKSPQMEQRNRSDQTDGRENATEKSAEQTRFVTPMCDRPMFAAAVRREVLRGTSDRFSLLYRSNRYSNTHHDEGYVDRHGARQRSRAIPFPVRSLHPRRAFPSTRRAPSPRHARNPPYEKLERHMCGVRTSNRTKRRPISSSLHHESSLTPALTPTPRSSLFLRTRLPGVRRGRTGPGLRRRSEDRQRDAQGRRCFHRLPPPDRVRHHPRGPGVQRRVPCPGR